MVFVNNKKLAKVAWEWWEEGAGRGKAQKGQPKGEVEQRSPPSRRLFTFAVVLRSRSSESIDSPTDPLGVIAALVCVHADS